MYSIVVIQVTNQFPSHIRIHKDKIFHYPHAVELVEQLLKEEPVIKTKEFIRKDNFWTCEESKLQIAIISNA